VAEFIRRKNYTDKTRCYECGDGGHLSYECPHNSLGDREPPPKKQKKWKYQDKDAVHDEEPEEEEEPSDEGEDPTLDSLSAAIQYQQMKVEEDEYRYKVATGNYEEPGPSTEDNEVAKKKIKPSGYFSDEEDTDPD